MKLTHTFIFLTCFIFTGDAELTPGRRRGAQVAGAARKGGPIRGTAPSQKGVALPPPPTLQMGGPKGPPPSLIGGPKKGTLSQTKRTDVRLTRQWPVNQHALGVTEEQLDGTIFSKVPISELTVGDTKVFEDLFTVPANVKKVEKRLAEEKGKSFLGPRQLSVSLAINALSGYLSKLLGQKPKHVEILGALIGGAEVLDEVATGTLMDLLPRAEDKECLKGKALLQEQPLDKFPEPDRFILTACENVESLNTAVLSIVRWRQLREELTTGLENLRVCNSMTERILTSGALQTIMSKLVLLARYVHKNFIGTSQSPVAVSLASIYDPSSIWNVEKKVNLMDYIVSLALEDKEVANLPKYFEGMEQARKGECSTEAEDAIKLVKKFQEFQSFLKDGIEKAMEDENQALSNSLSKVLGPVSALLEDSTPEVHEDLTEGSDLARARTRAALQLKLLKLLEAYFSGDRILYFNKPITQFPTEIPLIYSTITTHLTDILNPQDRSPRTQLLFFTIDFLCKAITDNARGTKVEKYVQEKAKESLKAGESKSKAPMRKVEL